MRHESLDMLPATVNGGATLRAGQPAPAFDLPDADYGAARALFVQMKDDAWKKVDEIKKDLGEKWDEVTGKKK